MFPNSWKRRLIVYVYKTDLIYTNSFLTKLFTICWTCFWTIFDPTEESDFLQSASIFNCRSIKYWARIRSLTLSKANQRSCFQFVSGLFKSGVINRKWGRWWLNLSMVITTIVVRSLKRTGRIFMNANSRLFLNWWSKFKEKS